MKLSKKQKEVIGLMQRGDKICLSRGMYPSAHLILNHKTMPITYATYLSLWRNKLIEQVEYTGKSNVEHYGLSVLGKTLAL